MKIETPLLILGKGPAAIVAAKIAGGLGQPCLLVGHEITGDHTPVELDEAATAVLAEHGLIDILRPYLVATDPLTIAPYDFEHVLKQHCVADLNVSVYDGFDVVECVVEGLALRGVLTDGRSKWNIAADAWIDTAELPPTLLDSVPTSVASVLAVLGTLDA